MEPFATYHAAFNAGCDLARQLGHDVGLERVKLPGSKKGEAFRVFSLPKPENRYGFEARCEVITPDMPKMGEK
jgi:hypothetical protein